MKKSEKKVLTSPDCHGIIIVVGSPDWLSGNKKSKSLGYRQAVRHWILTPAFRRFESFYPSHVGAVVTAPIFSLKKSVVYSSVRPTRFSPQAKFRPCFWPKRVGRETSALRTFRLLLPKKAGIFGTPPLPAKPVRHCSDFPTHSFLAFCFPPLAGQCDKTVRFRPKM